jgi:hypothetical protein
MFIACPQVLGTAQAKQRSNPGCDRDTDVGRELHRIAWHQLSTPKRLLVTRRGGTEADAEGTERRQDRTRSDATDAVG